MKFIFHISILTLSFLGVSNAYAQEGQADVSAAPQAAAETAAPADMEDEFAIEPEEESKKADAKNPAKNKKIAVDPLDPISGTVPLSDVPFYDFYERRVRYKKADKDYRQSIEARRESFIKPETEKRKAADARLEQIYKDEANPKSASFTKAPAPAIKDAGKGWKSEDEESADPRPVVPVGQPGDGMDKSPQDPSEKTEAVDAKNEKPESVVPANEQPASEAPAVAAPAGSIPLKSDDAKAAVAKPAEAKPSATPQAAVAPNAVAETPKGPVKEIPIEATPKDDEAAKKVVVPSDAPDFEKSPFGE